MTKSECRSLFKQKRQELSAAQMIKLDDLLLIQFQQLHLDIPNSIMTYSSIEDKNEFNPQLIVDYCSFKNPGDKLFYPVMKELNGDHFLQAVMVDDDTAFVINNHGIEEPIDGLDMFATEIDLVIVPLLCVDQKGYRVGYGKGYYDRFLSQCRKDCLKIGFSYFEPVNVIDDVNAFDIKLDFCITPEMAWQF